jgi:hypothetical protein
VYAGWEATFDASGSTGDGLSFAIDFGDGTVAKTAVTPHVFDRVGGFNERTVRATVTDRFGRVGSAAVTLRLANILTTGPGDMFTSINREDLFGPFRSGSRHLFFQDQNGTQLTGKYEEYGHPGTTPLMATLSGANHIHVRLDDGTIDMDGTFTLQGPVDPFNYPWLILSVRGGSADGMVVPFAFAPGY